MIMSLSVWKMMKCLNAWLASENLDRGLEIVALEVH